MIHIFAYCAKRSSSGLQLAKRTPSSSSPVAFSYPPRRLNFTLHSLQSQSFFLLHLCLLREYVDLEFKDVEHLLPFQYNLERIIDDFVLLAVFVGNDFLPHLPDLHIHDNALERLFNIYKSILPQAGGYINTSGVIDVQRLQLVLDALSESEVEVFHKEMGDVNWVKSKRKAPPPEVRKGSLRECAIRFTEEMLKAQNAEMTGKQNEMFNAIRKAVF